MERVDPPRDEGSTRATRLSLSPHGDAAQVPDRQVCAFCGGLDVTEEHVWAKWVSRELKRLIPNPRIHPFVMSSADGDKRRGQIMNIVTNKVCRECNNTWLSAIEERAKSRLVQLFNTGSVLYLAEDQLALATWATKTMLTSELASTSRPVLPPDFYRAFRQVQRPFDGLYIFMAAYMGDRIAGRYERTDLTIGNLHAATRRSNAFTATVQVYRAMFLILGHVEGKPVRPKNLGVLRKVVIQVWPPTGAARRFPPHNVAFNDESLRRFREMVTDGRPASDGSGALG